MDDYMDDYDHEPGTHYLSTSNAISYLKQEHGIEIGLEELLEHVTGEIVRAYFIPMDRFGRTPEVTAWHAMALSNVIMFDPEHLDVAVRRPNGPFTPEPRGDSYLWFPKHDPEPDAETLRRLNEEFHARRDADEYDFNPWAGADEPEPDDDTR